MAFACPWIHLQVTQRVLIGCWFYGHPIFSTVIIFLVQTSTKQQDSAQSVQKVPGTRFSRVASGTDMDFQAQS